MFGKGDEPDKKTFGFFSKESSSIFSGDQKEGEKEKKTSLFSGESSGIFQNNPKKESPFGPSIGTGSIFGNAGLKPEEKKDG